MTPRRKANYNPHSDQPHVSYRRLTWAPLRHNYKSIVAGDDSTFGCGCGKATPEPSSAQDHAFSSVSSFAFHRQLSGTPRTTSAGSSPTASQSMFIAHSSRRLSAPQVSTNITTISRTTAAAATYHRLCAIILSPQPLFARFPLKGNWRLHHDVVDHHMARASLPVATFVGTAIWLMGDGNK
jgi:hypothetical protein